MEDRLFGVEEYPLPADPRAALMSEWLLSKGTTLWGRPFELVKDGPNRAVQWLIEQLDSYEEFVKSKEAPKPPRRKGRTK